jgi:RIO-like serine/threonine protein kinase
MGGQRLGLQKESEYIEEGPRLDIVERKVAKLLEEIVNEKIETMKILPSVHIDLPSYNLILSQVLNSISL